LIEGNVVAKQKNHSYQTLAHNHGFSDSYGITICWKSGVGADV
jgi:hypothetical protein